MYGHGKRLDAIGRIAPAKDGVGVQSIATAVKKAIGLSIGLAHEEGPAC
jgi:hypothetical protein